MRAKAADYPHYDGDFDAVWQEQIHRVQS